MRQGLRVVVEAELVTRTREGAARRGPTEMAPPLSVPVLEREHQLLRGVRPRDHARIGEEHLDRDVGVGRLQQLVAREVQDAVGRRLLAERIDVLAEVERQERVVVEVGVCLRGQEPIPDDLDARADRIDLGVLRCLRHLGEPAAHPQPFDVIHRGRLEPQRTRERDLATIDLELRGLELLPPRSVPVLPLEQAREIARAALGCAEEDPQERRITGVREPWIGEVEIALDPLRTCEHLERALGP